MMPDWQDIMAGPLGELLVADPPVHDTGGADAALGARIPQTCPSCGGSDRYCTHGGAVMVWQALDQWWASRKLIADLRALHRPDSKIDPWCDEDWFSYPCRTIRMIDEAGL